MTRFVCGFVAAAALALPAVAGDKAPKAAKPYPISEHRYIKQFAGPTISCGACFGYYRTQWRTWEEACNEPLPVDPGPKQYTPQIPIPPEPMPEPMKKEPEKKDPPKKDPPKKEPEKKKQNTSVDLPVISIPQIAPPVVEEKPAPLPLPKVVDKPTPASNIEIIIPAVPQVQPGLVKPVEPLPPTVIVPVPSK